jgi:hypothetical protein
MPRLRWFRDRSTSLITTVGVLAARTGANIARDYQFHTNGGNLTASGDRYRSICCLCLPHRRSLAHIAKLPLIAFSQVSPRCSRTAAWATSMPGVCITRKSSSLQVLGLTRLQFPKHNGQLACSFESSRVFM